MGDAIGGYIFPIWLPVLCNGEAYFKFMEAESHGWRIVVYELKFAEIIQFLISNEFYFS